MTNIASYTTFRMAIILKLPSVKGQIHSFICSITVDGMFKYVYISRIVVNLMRVSYLS